MSLPVSIQRYLSRHARTDMYKLVAPDLGRIDQAVVIPALAEREDLFETLRRLCANPPEDLDRTLVIAVINNRREGIADAADVENNRQTMRMLDILVRKDAERCATSGCGIEKGIAEILASGLRLAYIDASSRGLEMPDKGGGVGLARKIGLDMAMRLMDYRRPTRKLLISLDADTWVEPQYLSAVRRFFESVKAHAAVVAFAHRLDGDPALRAAICCYEIFLRYYTLGLAFAGSPYAFHTIASTMVCTCESYAAVRGMNRREAAEDFYFLDKLAKLGPISEIRATTVYPSARPSRRVPFGTGQRVIRFLQGVQDEYLVYHPEVFRILREWLLLMDRACRQDSKSIQDAASGIHPLMDSFLEQHQFQEVWHRIQRNHREPSALARQFHVWFDAFKTLKLVHYLTTKGFPHYDMFLAVKDLFERMQIHFPYNTDAEIRSDIAEQLRILIFLRQYGRPNISLT
jgi:hypothetical protein